MFSRNELKEAMEKNQFLLYLQPKYSLVEELPRGAEVLVRWQHPQRGLLEPDEFLGDFIQTGLIWDLDCLIWEMACQMMKEWNRKGWNHTPLSINISKSSFFHPNLEHILSELFCRYGVRRNDFWLEITEAVFMEQPEQTKEIIRSLHSAGFVIVLDNYGYGYSSIKSLSQMKIDMLKVDMRFFSDCGDLEKGEMVLSSVIKLANWIGISVTAEGVENSSQKGFAKTSGCEYIQGYSFSEPISRQHFEDSFGKQPITQTAAKNRTDNRKEEPAAPKETILIIDDSVMELELMRGFLEDQFQVHTCVTAEEGMEYLKENADQVQMILVDYLMPGMDGLEFLKECRKSEVFSMIPKVMITSNECSQDQILAFQEGIYDYIKKPLIPEVVLARINHILDLHRKLTVTEVAEETYRRESEYDKATDLLNKGTFEKRVRQYLSKKPENQNALIVVDIDNFKGVNDKYGHLQGDEVIKLVAEELSHCFRSSDVIGRFGGDEFVVFMTSIADRAIPLEKAQKLIEKIKSESIRQLEIPASTSMGIAFYQDKDSFDSLFERADQALYAAKKGGKGQAVCQN